MSSGGDAWSDRRGMFQRGKELHAPASPTGRKFHETGAVTSAVRRASTTSEGPGSPLDKTPSGGSSGGGFPTASGRRRSSAGSGKGMFGNLTHQKRGSEDYGERRASVNEMQNNGGGVMSGWFNTTFKGHQKPVAGGEDLKKDQKRGVME